MAKGKYGEAAAMRRAEIEASGNLETHQRRVAELTAENKSLKERLVEKDRTHSRETRRLKAERNEGTSPTLRAIEAECKRLREELDRSERDRKNIRKQWSASATGMREHFIRHHGMGRADSWEAVMRIAGGDVVLQWDGEDHLTPLVAGWEKQGIPTDEIDRRIDAFSAVTGARRLSNTRVAEEV